MRSHSKKGVIEIKGRRERGRKAFEDLFCCKSAKCLLRRELSCTLQCPVSFNQWPQQDLALPAPPLTCMAGAGGLRNGIGAIPSPCFGEVPPSWNPKKRVLLGPQATRKCCSIVAVGWGWAVPNAVRHSFLLFAVCYLDGLICHCLWSILGTQVSLA